MDPLIGRRLKNRYEVLGKVGEGGMAVVYRAKDVLLGRTVAVKVLREQFASDADFVARFRLEAQAAASLSHPNVVNIFDVGEDDGVHYIVMEYVEGENLKERIRRGRLSIDEAVFIGREIAKALDAAHRQGLVHRDIKPHNVLLTRDGAVKVTDFGIARAANAATSLTATGTVIGSVHYFSPEQARGDVVDSASDIYSLGIVLYEMVTGTLPFTGESPVAIALKHLNETSRPVRELNPAVPRELERIIQKATAKSKEERYRSAKELLADLRRVSLYDGVGLEQAPDPPRPAPPPPSPPPEPVDSAATQVYAATAVVEEATRTHELPEGEMPVSSRRPQKKRRRRLVWLFVFLSFAGGVVWASQELPKLIFPEEVRVPDVTGLSVAEARRALAEAGLRLQEAGDEYNAAVPAGAVIRQNPEANQRVRMGREIRVWVSRGPEFVVVPDVIGRPKIEAELTITQEGLVLGGVVEEFRTDVPPNTVIGQNPPPSTRIEKGKAVELIVARGSQPQQRVVMPDVRGMELEAARRRLQALGFVEGQLHPEPYPGAPANQVIDQNPPPGEVVEAGYPYSLAYAVPPTGSEPEQAIPQSVDERYWETQVLIHVPEGPSQEVVVSVSDEWGLRQVFREERPGGSRFYVPLRIRGDRATIQVWFDGVPQLHEVVTRP